MLAYSREYEDGYELYQSLQRCKILRQSLRYHIHVLRLQTLCQLSAKTIFKAQQGSSHRPQDSVPGVATWEVTVLQAHAAA